MNDSIAWFAIFTLALAAPSAARSQSMSMPDALEERSGRELLKERIEEAQRILRTLRAIEKTQAVPSAARDKGATLEPKIVNGVLTVRHPTAGALLKIDGSILSGHCSGTLIGSRTFLTAAHCVAKDRSSRNYRVFLQHAGIFEVASIDPHPDYVFPVADLAVLKLSNPVRDIRPMGLRSEAIPVGTDGLVVGFGRSGGERDDYGLKRVGSIKTAQCRTQFDNSKLVCWNYKDPVGAPGTSSNTCNSDSGGPLYAFGAGRLELAGVTSGGAIDSCLQGDHSYDVNVSFYRSWIASKLGTDTGEPGSGPIVLESGTRVTGESSTLTSMTGSKRFTTQIRASTRTVRVALHGHDDSEARFGYKVAFTPTGAQTPELCEPLTGQWAFCNFATKRRGGIVSVEAQRLAGEGEFQVTVTELD